MATKKGPAPAPLDPKVTKKLLDKLAGHLTDDGVLVLECGVKGGAGKKQWHVVPRWDGAKRYPRSTCCGRSCCPGTASAGSGRA